MLDSQLSDCFPPLHRGPRISQQMSLPSRTAVYSLAAITFLVPSTECLVIYSSDYQTPHTILANL